MTKTRYHTAVAALSPTQTDEEIVGLIQKGDRDQFGTIVERYEQRLLRYGRKFMSEGEDIVDIVQDVFVSTYENIQSFDTSQKFSPWIYRIAHNAFVGGLRKRSRTPVSFIDLDTLIAHPVYEDPAMREREEGEMKRMIEQGLAQLSAKYREILVLHYIEDMSYRDIADILQIPVGTVGVRLRRAKESLRQTYEKMNLRYES